jgi:hypothetical protein
MSTSPRCAIRQRQWSTIGAGRLRCSKCSKANRRPAALCCSVRRGPATPPRSPDDVQSLYVTPIRLRSVRCSVVKRRVGNCAADAGRVSRLSGAANSRPKQKPAARCGVPTSAPAGAFDKHHVAYFVERGSESCCLSAPSNDESATAWGAQPSVQPDLLIPATLCSSSICVAWIDTA